MNFKVVDHSEEIKKALEKACASAMEEIGQLGERYAKLDCPEDTGNLRNSISHSANETTAVIGTNVEYAPYVELGALGRSAKPYLRPAASEHIDEYKGILEKHLKA